MRIFSAALAAFYLLILGFNAEAADSKKSTDKTVTETVTVGRATPEISGVCPKPQFGLNYVGTNMVPRLGWRCTPEAADPTFSWGVDVWQVSLWLIDNKTRLQAAVAVWNKRDASDPRVAIPAIKKELCGIAKADYCGSSSTAKFAFGDFQGLVVFVPAATPQQASDFIKSLAADTAVSQM